MNGRPDETIKVNCQVNTISFSAHSDYKGTLSLIKDLQPDHVVLGRCDVMSSMQCMVRRRKWTSWLSA